MENMDPSTGEYFKLKVWIDTFMRIPFNKYNNLPFNLKEDGIENVMIIWKNRLLL